MQGVLGCSMQCTIASLYARMAACSEVEDDILCKVASDTEAAWNDSGKQSNVIPQPTDLPEAPLSDTSVSKSPCETAIYDMTEDLIRIYGGNGNRFGDCYAPDCPSKTASCDVTLDINSNDGVDIDYEDVVMTSYHTDDMDHDIYSNMNETSVPICHDRDTSDELAVQNPTSNSNLAVADSCIEDHPHSIKSDCLPDTNVAAEATDISVASQVENAANNDHAFADGKLDCIDSDSDLFDEKLITECSADNAAECAVNDLDSGSCKSAENQAKENTPTSNSPRTLSFSSDVLLVAPTGKAANVLGRRTGLQAFTMHQIIFSYRAWRRSDTRSRNAWKFDSVRALVVDECSLVAVTTFHSLISKVLPSLQKVVLLGDILQLPSIEPGTY